MGYPTAGVTLNYAAQRAGTQQYLAAPVFFPLALCSKQRKIEIVVSPRRDTFDANRNIGCSSIQRRDCQSPGGYGKHGPKPWQSNSGKDGLWQSHGTGVFDRAVYVPTAFYEYKSFIDDCVVYEHNLARKQSVALNPGLSGMRCIHIAIPTRGMHAVKKTMAVAGGPSCCSDTVFYFFEHRILYVCCAFL